MNSYTLCRLPPCEYQFLLSVCLASLEASQQDSWAASTNSFVSQATHSSSGGAALSISPQASSTDRDADKDPLPEWWEERQAVNGRTFYIDHISRQTMWHHPTSEEGARQRRVHMETDRRRMIAHTLARRNPVFP